MSRPHLTSDLQNSIVAYIRAGGFPHVAAEAAGVRREVFERWLHQGRGPEARSRYRAFFEAVLQARAQARLGAETAVLGDKPLDWLRSGPGRETAESAGWTGTVRPTGAATGRGGPVLAQEEVQALIATVLRLLEPYPEARAVVAARLAEPAQAGVSSSGSH